MLKHVQQLFTPGFLFCGELCHRELNIRHLPSLSAVANYNREVVKLNKLLKELLSSELESASFWRHPRNATRTCLLEADGTHFNSSGMRNLFRSIRGALLKAQSTFDTKCHEASK